ncbi:MAG: tyrosine-type recombinase/integrase [Candidatus Bilamarchaeum sp.]
MADIDLYNYPKRLESAIDKLNKDSKIDPKNKKDIISFSKIRLAKGSTHGRVAKVIYCMNYWAQWIEKPFKETNKDDLIIAVGELENTKLAEHTRYDLKIVLKMFYKWLEGNDETMPSKIAWLKPKIKNHKHKLPEELLTEEEVLKLVDAAGNVRDKAFILIIYESGCRIGELLTLKIKNIGFDQYGGILRVNGKTGDRRVRIISSAPSLAAWIELHPKGKDPDAMLWHSTWRNSKQKKPQNLSHGTVYTLLKEYAVKAGIRKRIYPHLFRHSRATALANKLTESQMKEHFGWVQGSEMAATYVHLSGRDVDNALLKLQGLVQVEETKSEKLNVRVCPRCKDHNGPISMFCTKCGLPLNKEIILDVEKSRENSDALMNVLLQDPQFKEAILKKIFELKLENNVL